MKKFRKYLRFEKLKFELQQQHPKDISRVNLNLIQVDTKIIHKSKLYGVVTPTSIAWQEYIQFSYTAQEGIKFQTICQHEYGYQIQQLKALYNGILYIKTQNFFQNLSSHIFNQEGQKVGIFRYMIKVIQKQQSTPQVEQQQVQQQVKVDLIGRVTYYAAQLKITNINFNPKKHGPLMLKIKLGNLSIQTDQRKDNKWQIAAKKMQIMQNSQPQLIFEIIENNVIIFIGKLPIDLLDKNKRFLTHQVVMTDNFDTKMGVLDLDIRYLNKKQLLDLMYSPKKLSQSTMQIAKTSKIIPKLNLNKSHQKIPNKPTQVNSRVTGNSNDQLQKLLNKDDLNHREINRYKKVHIMNGYNQMIIPRAQRFTNLTPSHPYVSYVDPQKFSDFSPKNKGTSIGVGVKMDFTKPYKANPGVGQYKLPSIWDKY